LYDDLPACFSLSWAVDDLETFHSCDWWHDLLAKSKAIRLECIDELTCFEESWQDWLLCDNEYAINDRAAMAAGAGDYMNLIRILAKRNNWPMK
jgi:hypothetical protein